jgi:predicted CxxxxCH...CXXCH cytochrome family protein
MLARTPVLAVLAAMALGLAACGDARPVVGEVGGGGSLCTACHGTAGRTGTLPGTDQNLAAAPPVAPPGEPAAVVGAHQAHLNPTATGSLRGPIACNECHVVPSDAAHATNPPAQIVQFGTLARTGGAAPTWNSTDKITNTTCSNVYCHGNFTFGTVTGTLANAPDWTGTSQAACGSCHGLPPTGHLALSGTPTAATCNGCHAGTVDTTGAIIVNTATGTSLHVNGQSDVRAHTDPSWLTANGGNHTAAALSQSPPFGSCLACHAGFGAANPNDVAGSSCNACHASALAGAATTNWQQNCVFCHGDSSKIATWTSADPAYEIAPPRGALGEALTTEVAVGAHQKHVNPTSNVLSNAIACTECHSSPLPADIGHVDGVIDLPLAGPLATNPTGTFTPNPSWNAGTAGCAATYCHGNYPQGGNAATPVWTTVDGSSATCASCHGAPPDTGEHYFHVFTQSVNCSICHNNIATGSGASAPITNGNIVNKSLHVNGVRNVVFGVPATWNPAPTAGNAAAGTCSNVACHGGTRDW